MTAFSSTTTLIQQQYQQRQRSQIYQKCVGSGTKKKSLCFSTFSQVVKSCKKPADYRLLCQQSDVFGSAMAFSENMGIAFRCPHTFSVLRCSWRHSVYNKIRQHRAIKVWCYWGKTECLTYGWLVPYCLAYEHNTTYTKYTLHERHWKNEWTNKPACWQYVCVCVCVFLQPVRHTVTQIA